MKEENPQKEYLKMRLVFIGGIAIHNLQCWLCNKNPAVYNMNPNWVFQPCWECQKDIKGKIYRLSGFTKWLVDLFN